MTIRSSESTPLRPDGKRTLNAPLVKMDLHKYIKQIKQEKNWQKNELNSITLLKSDTMRVVLIGLHEGAVLQRHSARAHITVQVLVGAIEFHTDDSNTPLLDGQILALQGGIAHSVKAVEESFFLLTLAS